MRTMIWIVVIFAVAVGAAMFAEANHGYMVVVAPPWRAQVSLNLAIVGLILLVAAVYFLIRLLVRTIDLPGQVRTSQRRKRQEKAYHSLNAAMQAQFEGRHQDALRDARIAYNAGRHSPVAALVAARAAHALHDDRRYKEWLARANEPGDGRVAGLLTGAELAIEAGDLNEAQRALENLPTDGRSPQQLRVALDLAIAQERWADVRSLTQQLTASGVMTEADARNLRRTGHLAILRETVSNPERQLAYWREIDKDIAADPQLLAAALPYLAAAEQGGVARRQVERALEARWDSALARRYVLASGDGEEAAEAMRRAEGWLQTHGSDAGLLYSLGGQHLRAQDADKAFEYLDASLRAEANAETAFALAELMESRNNGPEALRYYREGVRLLPA